MARLAPKLPKGNANGLPAIDRALVDEPERVHAVVALVDCSKISTDIDTGDVEPTARIRRLEVVATAEHLEVVEKIMRRSLEQRTGKTVLPLDIEDELRSAFARITFDPATGEVFDAPDDGSEG